MEPARKKIDVFSYKIAEKDHLLEQEDSALLLSLSSGVTTARREVTGQEVTPL